jgi:hypothetical protein
MRYQEICETPIEDFAAHNMDREGTFSAKDRAILQDPQQVRHIKKRFETVPYTFNLYFINQPQKSYTKPLRPGDVRGQGQTARFTSDFTKDMDAFGGISTPEKVRQLTGITVNPTADTITVVFLSNANETYSMPLTPWIIAHRIGHALSDNTTWTQALRQLPGDRTSELINGSPVMLKDILQMKSAKTGTMLNGEASVEMIAAYLLTGDVEMRPPANRAATPAVQMDIQKLAQRTLRALDRLLDEANGRVFIAV